ncbi:MAG: 50S ribosomal protein L9 [Oligoflexia bacterium]|nr:50S ribosomal protein L9 [Oligoflexia bacterium]
MKVILKEQVKSLGSIGDIVAVSAGFARNYLIPRRLAILADEANTQFVEDQKRRLSKKINAQREHAMSLKKQIDGLQLEFFKRVGGNGKLFGAVTNSELANELKNRSIEVERRWIQVDNPIKELGSFDIKVKIFADVEATFNIKVNMDPKQIEELKKKAEQKKQAQKDKDAADKRAAERAAEEAAIGGDTADADGTTAARATAVAAATAAADISTSITPAAPSTATTNTSSLATNTENAKKGGKGSKGNKENKESKENKKNSDDKEKKKETKKGK